MKLLINKKILADQLSVSASYIDRAMKRGLPTVKLGRAVRFEPSAVLAWIKEKSVK